MPERPRALTVPRAVAAVAALCVAALIAAVVAARSRGSSERAAPPEGFSPLGITKLDAHQRVPASALELALRVAQVHRIGAVVNLSGGAEGAVLDASLAAARRHGGRVVVFMNLDEASCCDAGWAPREAGRLARGKARGARGLALGAGPLREALASARLEPLWEACAALGLPVALGDVGTQAERVALVERHPRVFFVAERFAESAGDPASASRLMDRLPNLWVDTAGCVPALARSPEATRSAILAHPDRVLFGSGVRYVEDPGAKGIVLASGPPILLEPRLLGGEERRIFFESAFRFFETRDAGIPSPTPGQEPGELTGIGLSREVLQQLYRRNAERLLGVHAPEVED